MGKNYLLRVSKLIAFLFLLLIFFTPFAIVNVGERGVLLQLGKVQDRILEEGIHLIIPVINTVEKLSVQIQKQEIVSNEIDDKLTTRLAKYHISVDDVSLVRIQFSEKFRQAVEAKQIAEQAAKRAKFLALKALNEAKANINLSPGEAEAQMLLRQTLSPELILKQAIEKWDGHLPSIVESELK